MTMDGTPLSKSQREHHHYLTDALARVEFDMHHRIWINHRVPRGWREIANSPTPDKRRVTIRLDEDVVKFFRSMGRDYGPRMNDVLKGFMHAKLMGLFKGDETLDQFREQEEHGLPERPGWGHTEDQIARIAPSNHGIKHLRLLAAAQVGCSWDNRAFHAFLVAVLCIAFQQTRRAPLAHFAMWQQHRA